MTTLIDAEKSFEKIQYPFMSLKKNPRSRKELLQEKRLSTKNLQLTSYFMVKD